MTNTFYLFLGNRLADVENIPIYLENVPFYTQE
jgi:hypothetical protein